MIIRILNEGQYEIGNDTIDHLNQIDDRIEAAVEANDEDSFRAALEELHEAVVAHGKPVSEDFIGESELLLPDTDATIDEIKSLLGDEGLIPD